MWAINDLEWRKYLSYNIVCYYIQCHQPRGYGALEFEVGCLGLYILRHYCKLEIVYEDYYHHHQTSTSSQPTFIMTWIETIPDHVKNKAKDQPKKWEQIMSNCQKLTCLTNVTNRTMASIIWKTVKYYVQEAHLGINE